MNRRSVPLCMMLPLILAACAEPTPPPPSTSATAKGNSLENTVLDAQGRALQSARDVQKQVDDQAAATRQAIDEAEGQ